MSRKPYVILVGMDYSELAERALAEAFSQAARNPGAEIHVLTVLAGAAVDPLYAMRSPLLSTETNAFDQALSGLREHVQSRLDARRAHHASEEATRVVSHVRIGSPGIGIVQLASDLGANLVIVGTHSRRGVARLLMGSVAEETVRYSSCPVLVIPPEAKVVEIRIEPPCAECVLARSESGRTELWCEQHRVRHGRRHTYHQTDRAGNSTNMPLVFK